MFFFLLGQNNEIDFIKLSIATREIPWYIRVIFLKNVLTSSRIWLRNSVGACKFH